MLHATHSSFPHPFCKRKACIAQGQTFSETAMVIRHLHGNSKSLQIVSDHWGLLGGKQSWWRGGVAMDPTPLDDVPATGCASMDNWRHWMAVIRSAECNKLGVAVCQNLSG